MILKTIHGGKEPKKGQVGLDLFANEDIIIRAGETKEVRLGVCVDHKKLRNIILDYYGIPATNSNVEDFIKSHHLELYPQDNIKAKGLVCSPSIISLKYAGEISIVIHNPVMLDDCDFSSQNVCLNLAARITDASVDEYRRAVDELMKKHEGHFVKEIKKCDRIAQILLKDHKSYLFWEE